MWSSRGGKSTLARVYTERYVDEAVLVVLDMYNRLPEIWYGILFICNHPRSFFWLLMFVFRYHMRGLFWYSFHLAVRACAKFQKAVLMTHSRTIVIDEGLVHAICVLSSVSLEKEEMGRWIHRIVLPDVICITTSGDFHRFHNAHAGLHPRVRKGEEQLKRWESAVTNNTIKVRSCLDDRNIPIWHIPEKTTSSPQESIETLHKYLATI